VDKSSKHEFLLKSRHEKEVYLPFIAVDDSSKTWLSIGSPLQEACPIPSDLDQSLEAFSKESYNLRHGAGQDEKAHLVVLKDAQGQDLIRGMLHARLLRQTMQKDPSRNANTIDKRACSEVETIFPKLQGYGWKTDTDLTTVEGSKARRLEIEHSHVEHGEHHEEEWI
jgi:hypothetical protein